MKALLTILLFCSLHAGAQTVETPNLRLEYVTYAQGYLVLNAKSLTDSAALKCGLLEVRLRWGSSGDTTLYFKPTEQRQIMLPSLGVVPVLFKTVAACNNGSNGGGWLTLSLTTLSLREDTRIRYTRAIPEGVVRVVSINGNFGKEMSEKDFQKAKEQYKRNYFILRNNKPKEVIL